MPHTYMCTCQRAPAQKFVHQPTIHNGKPAMCCKLYGRKRLPYCACTGHLCSMETWCENCQSILCSQKLILLLLLLPFTTSSTSITQPSALLLTLIFATGGLVGSLFAKGDRRGAACAAEAKTLSASALVIFRPRQTGS